VVHGPWSHDEPSKTSLAVASSIYGNRATLFANRSISLHGRIVPGSQLTQLRNLRYRLIDDKRDVVAARRA